MPSIVYTDMTGQERTQPFGPEYPVVTIGRSTDCDIRSNRKSVSRHHAELRFSNGRCEIIDLNSSNGTYLMVDGQRKPVQGREYLTHAEELWCGDFILRFVVEEEVTGRFVEELEIDLELESEHEVDFEERRTGAGPRFDGPPEAPFEQAYDGGATAEESSVAWNASAPAAEGVEQLQLELERLRAEKRSIEDLAARQARELEELESSLREMARKRDEATAVTGGPSLEQLELLRAELRENEEALRQSEEARRALDSRVEELQRVSEAAARLEGELAQLRHANEGLQAELAEAHRRLASMAEELEAATRQAELAEQGAQSAVEVATLREALEDRDAEIEELRDRIEQLDSQLEYTEAELRVAQSVADAAQESDAGAEVEALRTEADRQRRLVEEFERRHRELQLELEGEREGRARLEARIEEQEAAVADALAERDDRAAELEARDAVLEARDAALADAEAELQAARAEADELRAEVERLRADTTAQDLRNEVEGLKQRLRLEKKRASKGDQALVEEKQALEQAHAELREAFEALRAENDALQDDLSAAEARAEETEEAEKAADGGPAEGLDAAFADDLRGRAQALDRVVDAIERADLHALSTVDRVRLQSALRDTEPRQALREMIELIEGRR